ncbi:MAG TPA: hypothetical protein VFJ04_04030 [Rhodanobacteraceae bacterium]|nr:hypothetical protein [Rhodanobacteraceae bacterium]
MTNEAALAAALRALPQQASPHDGWPLLAARLHRRQRLRRGLRWAVPATLAAGVVLALLVPANVLHIDAPATHQVAASTLQHATTTADTQLTALRARSQRLETWVRELGASGAPLDGDALASAAELEDLIGLVDLQLGAAGDSRAQLPLWRQRVALLQQLATLRLTEGAGYESTVSNDSPTARPAIWID